MPKIKAIVLSLAMCSLIGTLGCVNYNTKPTKTSESKTPQNMYLQPDIPVNQVEKQVAKKLGPNKVLISTGVKEVNWANPKYKKKLYTFQIVNEDLKISINAKNGEIEEIQYPTQNKERKQYSIDEKNKLINKGMKLAEDTARKYYKLNIKNMRYFPEVDLLDIWKEDFSFPAYGIRHYIWRQVQNGVETSNYVNISVNITTNRVISYNAHYEDIVVRLKSKLNREMAINEAKKYAQENGIKYPVKILNCKLIVSEDKEGNQILKWVGFAVPEDNSYHYPNEIHINALTGKAYAIEEYKSTYDEQYRTISK